MLKAQGVRKPGLAHFYGPGNRCTRVPVPKMYALLKTEVGDEICCVESPFIISCLCIELQDAGAGVRVLRPVTSSIDRHASYGIDIDSRSVVSGYRIVDFKAIK